MRQALVEDFHGKCYLCEGSAAESFDVEHLRPVADFPGEEFDWENLFPAHSRCNERRKRWTCAELEPQCSRWPRGGMLSPTGDDVEGRLLQDLSLDEAGAMVAFAPRNPVDLAAANTAAELAHIHSRGGFWGRQICSLIEGRYRSMLKATEDFFAAVRGSPDPETSDRAGVAPARLRELLAPDAPYAALLRAQMRRAVAARWHAQLGL